MARDYQTAKPEQYQRRPEYRREDAWIREFLRQGMIAHVGHLSNGQPFITPTNYWFDEERHQLVFHSNIAGRVRSNLEHNPRVCVEVSEFGRLLPANTALEFSIQYRSVLVYGEAAILSDPEEQERAMYGLIGKYFPLLTPGKEYRPIQPKELARTSVYAVKIDAWTGKENWQEEAIQSLEWTPLP